MAHNNTTTHNSNNNYSVDIVVDPNLSGGSGSNVKYSSLTNSPYYELKIMPPYLGVPLFAGNIKIDSIDSDWSYITNLHPHGSTSCTPHPTPHGISSQIAHTYMFGPGGTNCYPAVEFHNGSYDFQGPYTFTNDAYTNGAFLTDGNPVTWSKIHLIEVYNNDAGGLENDDVTPEGAENELTWNTWNTSKSTITYSPEPAYLKAFVYVVYDPNIDIGYGNNITLNLDIDEVAPIVGCMDSSAINGSYNANATISDPTACQYPVPEYSVSISPINSPLQDSTGLYTSTFLNTQYVLSNIASNIYINIDASGHYQTLINTYQPGQQVNEIVVIDIIPIYPNAFFPFPAAYDFPVASNPPATNGGPNANIPQTTGYSQNPASWGESKNNLTAASIRFLNAGTGANPSYEIPVDDGSGNLLFNYGGYSQWHNQTDPTGLQPTMEVTFENQIFTTDPSGNPLEIDTNGIYLREHYYTVGAPELLLNPGFEWFPHKLELSIQLDFVMPAYNVDIKLDLDHNTENQGDFSWIDPSGPPVYGCTDPTSFNYDPLANTDDGSCVPVISGCTDPTSFNYDPTANTDDGGCVPIVYGCINPLDSNYDPLANTDDGSCAGSGGTGGGKILCATIYEATGLSDWEEKGILWNKHLNKHLTKYHQVGYHALFYKFTLLMKKYKSVYKLGKYMTVQRSKDLEAVMSNNKRHLPGMIVRYVFEPLCYLIGWIKSK